MFIERQIIQYDGIKIPSAIITPSESSGAAVNSSWLRRLQGRTNGFGLAGC